MDTRNDNKLSGIIEKSTADISSQDWKILTQNFLC